MSMDVSQLSIEVKTNGIQEASDALGSKGLSRSARNAADSVQKLTDNLANLMKAGGNVVGPMSGLTGVVGLVNTALGNAVAQATALTAALATQGAVITSQVNALGQHANAMNNAATATKKAADSTAEFGRRGGVMTTTLKAMATAAIAYFSINSAKHVVEESDAWGMMQAKLKIATGSMEKAKEVQGELFDMAQQLRTPLADMGVLYGRLSPALARLGKSSQDTKNMVESVALALKLQGATGAEAASTMLQFSQSANAGRLNGAEFNSVAENGVEILRALESYLGKNMAQLKKMGAEGKLTFDIISAALEKKRPEWEAAFASLPLTFEGAMQRLKNAWMKTVGELGQDNEMGRNLALVVGQIEAALPTIAVGVVNIIAAVTTGFAALIDNAKPILTVIGGIVGIAFAKWAQTAVIGLTAMIDAAGAGAVAMRGLQVAMTFMGGPIGIVTGLLAAAATAWTLWGDKAVDASKVTTAQVKSDADKRVDAIQFEINKLNERNKVAKAGRDEDTGGTPLSAVSQGLLNDLSKLRKDMGAAGLSKETRDVMQNLVNAKQAQFEQSLATDNTLAGLRKVNAEAEKQAKLTEMVKNDREKLAKGEMKAEIEIQKKREEYALAGGTLPKDIEAAIREKYTHAEAKAETAAAKAMREANSERERAKKTYAEMNAAYTDMVKSGRSDDKRTATEHELLKMQNEAAALAPGALKNVKLETVAILEKQVAIEKAKEGYKNYLKTQEDSATAQYGTIAETEKEIAVLQDKIAEYGKLKGSAEDYALTTAKVKLATMLMFDNGTDANGEIARQRTIVANLETIAELTQKVNSLSLGDKIAKDMANLKPEDFGSGFGDAFGSIGKAIDKAGKSLDTYSKKMTNLNKIRAEINKDGGEKKHGAELEKLRNEELKGTLDMYGDMAGAVKGFFNEKTVAYKVFNAIEQGMRVARMAMDIKEFAIKQMNEETWLGLKLKNAIAAMTMDDAETANSEGNSLIKAAASTAAGVAKAFEQLGVWGFVGAAAIIAFMASFGVGGGGGGASVPSLKDQRQKANGTGTVLGNEDAKTESLTKAMDLLVNKYNMGLDYSSRMLSYLRSINDGISSLASGVVALNGVRGTSADQFKAGVGSSKSALGFGSSSTDMTDSGLQFDPNQTVGGIMQNGANVQGYYDLHKQSSSWWGLSKSSSNEHVNTQVDGAFKQQVTATVADMVNLTTVAAKGLGVADQGLADTISKMKLGIDMVSLNGLSGDDLTNALNAAFSKLGDEMASAVVNPTLLKQFQKVGEGSLETLVRLSSGLENATMLMGNLGIQVASFNDIANKHGDVDAELVRASIDAKEAGTNVAQFVDEMSGSAEDIVAAYKTLVDVRSTLKALGAGNDVSRALVNGAGGLDALSSGLGDFVSNFYDDSKKAAIGLSKLRDQFNALGVQMPATKDGFKTLVESLMAGDAASQTMAGRLMGLSSAFSDAMDSVDSAVSSKKDALKTAYDDQSSALQDTITKMQDFVKTMGDFKQSLMLGDLSTQNALEKYQTAKKAYDDTYSKAMGGDQDALDKFQDVANTFLQASRTVNASGEGYTSDYETVLKAIDQVQGAAQGQADTATTQLDAMKKQVGALIDLTDKVTTVTQAIIDLNAALTGTDSTTAATVTQVVTQPTQSGAINSNAIDGTDAADAMLNAANAAFQSTNSTATTSPDAAAAINNPTTVIGGMIQRLVAEVAQLRQEQAQQTAAVIAANYDANEQNAQTVADATTQAAQDAAYVQTVQTGLN